EPAQPEAAGLLLSDRDGPRPASDRRLAQHVTHAGGRAQDDPRRFSAHGAARCRAEPGRPRRPARDGPAVCERSRDYEAPGIVFEQTNGEPGAWATGERSGYSGR